MTDLPTQARELAAIPSEIPWRQRQALEADILTALQSIAVANAEIERLRGALDRLENVNEQLCQMRTQEIYDAMIAGGQSDALLELDSARRDARAALTAAKQAMEGGDEH